MDKELKDFQMEIFTKVAIMKENLMDLDNIIGQMEAILKGNLRMD